MRSVSFGIPAPRYDVEGEAQFRRELEQVVLQLASDIADSTLSTGLSLTYGTTVNTNAARGDNFSIEVTDTVAFTVANPTKSRDGQRLQYDVYNNSGGAMGTVTFGSDFKLAGSWVSPADTTHRLIGFFRDGLLWRETFRTAADVPN